MPIKYKVLREDLRSPFQDFQYQLGTWVEEPNVGKDGSEGCLRGLYATDLEGLLYRGVYREGESVYRVEVTGRKAGVPPFKTCWEKLRVLELVPEAEVRQLARAGHERLEYLLEEALYPVQPWQVRPHKWTRRDQQLLKRWASVWDSVRANVRASVRDSVGAIVWDSVWDNVWDSVLVSVGAIVWDSVWDNVWDACYAYAGSLFPGVETWKGFEDVEGYPFESGAALWRRGFVPTWDGNQWIVCGSPDGKVVWKGMV